MTAPYFFLRPILAADRSWAALNWQSSHANETESSDLIRCFTEAGIEPLAKQLPLVFTVDPAWLEQDLFVKNFDARQAVILLPASSLTTPQAIERCTQLREQGYRFGLQIDTPDLLRKIPLAAFSFIQFEAAFARQDLPLADLAYAKDAGFKMIASNVGTAEMFGWLSEKHFDWVDSRFLTARNPLLGREPDLTRLKLLKLLNLVKQDGDTREIEEIFREEPKLAYNLLRLVNSVAVGARTKISSFSQAIAILGRRQLQRWLQLLIYANNLDEGNAPNPLMQLAATRGRQMELLSAAIAPKPSIPDLSDNAFMTGLFSLLEVLINLPILKILEELPMQSEVVEALSPPNHGGILGQLLSAIIAGEAGNFSTAEAIFSGLGISPETHAKSQVTATYWASRINIENHD